MDLMVVTIQGNSGQIRTHIHTKITHIHTKIHTPKTKPKNKQQEKEKERGVVGGKKERKETKQKWGGGGVGWVDEHGY